jgi:L-cysteate sulfo-lyase
MRLTAASPNSDQEPTMPHVTPEIAAHPRQSLLEGPTPIQHLARLSASIGAEVYVKRDDLMGLGGGGNKLRKLEFLLGEALRQGADTVITVGALQSNHARLTAAAAVRAGLACELVLTGSAARDDEDYRRNGNVLLDGLFGARIHTLPAGADAAAFAATRRAALEAEGRRVYLAPLGGSSATGCLGYAACAFEIADQERALGLHFDHIVLPNGSGGTQAGLVAGHAVLGLDPGRVRAYTVLALRAQALDTTRRIAAQTLQLLRPEAALHENAVRIDGSQLGPGYGVPTAAMREAVALMAKLEGLLIDPVYGGKAFAGLLEQARAGAFARGERVLFLMTGGLPGLFAYRSAFD